MPNTTLSGYTKTQRSGAIAVVAGASLWGLFWIPLRYLDTLDVDALWALTFVMAAALLPAIVMMILKGDKSDLTRLATLRAGTAMGLATTLYFVALMYTDVIRAVFLFYLLPLWTTVSARLIYGEPVSTPKTVIMFIALAGLWLLLSEGNGFPIPQSTGDWCAIASGFFWGVSLSLLRAEVQRCAYSRTLVTIGSAVVLSVLVIVIFKFTGTSLPSQPAPAGGDNASTQSRTLLVVIIAMLFGIVAIYPAMIAQIWGAAQLPAPTAALLTMSEILVAIASAAILIGTDMSPLAIMGGSIIIFSLCLDVVMQFAGKEPASV